MTRLEGSARTLPSPELEHIARRFQGDRELLSQSLLLAEDSTARDTARLNGLILRTALEPGHPARWQVKGIDWSRGDIRGAKLVDMTLSSGKVSAVAFRDSTFAGVVWGSYPVFEMSKGELRAQPVLFHLVCWHQGSRSSVRQQLAARFRDRRYELLR